MEETRKRKYPYKESPKCTCQGFSSQEVDENSYGPEHCEKCTKQMKGNNADASLNKPDQTACVSDGKPKTSALTPAPAFNRNLLAPGSDDFLTLPTPVHEVEAPRVLVENHQLNADPAPEFLNLDAFHQQFMRTPPSVKNQRLCLTGNSPQQYRGYDRFDRISDEIILKVFHFLPRHHMCTCALVCRRWARIVCDMSLWKRMDMGGCLVKRGVLKLILERGVEFFRLNQSESSAQIQQSLQDTWSVFVESEIMGDFNSTVMGNPDPQRSPLSEDRLYRLRYLDMSMANVETSLVESMLKFCPNLHKISLENIPVTEQLLLNLSLNSPYLDTLNLCMSAGVTAKGLCYIFQNCTNLLELNIAWTGLSSSDIMVVAKAIPSQILSFNMSGCRERLKDDAVTALCKRCTQIQDLDLSDATQITNTSINTMVMFLHQLRMISLSRCYQISPSHIPNLTELPHLERINVFGIMRDVTLDMMEQHLSKYKINCYPFSAIARPTVNNSKHVKIWNETPRAKF